MCNVSDMVTSATQQRSKPGSRHANRSEATQAQLIQAAIRVVRDRGYQGASVFEVAKAAGLTPGSIQHHFGTKAVLMMRVVDALFDANGATAPGWPEASLPLAERARSTLLLLWQRIYEPERFLVAWQVYMGCSADEPVLHYIAEKRQAQHIQLVERILGLLPELPDSADTHSLLDVVLSSLRGMGLVRLLGPADASMAAQLEQLTTLLVQRCQNQQPQPTRNPRKRP